MHHQLNPRAKALLDQWAADAASKPQPAHLLSLNEQIAASRLAFHRLDPLAGEPEPVLHIVQRTLPGPGGPLPVRIYQPRDVTGLPVLVYLHGGGCTIGDLDTIDRPLRQLSNRSGWLIVSVGYRLAPEHPFPAAWEDAYTVTQWVATHASEINADASLLAIGGDSAGGLLATATTLMIRDRNGPGIALQILINPSTSGYADFDTRSWQDYDGMVLNQAAVKRDLDLTYGDQDRSHPWISPLKARDLAYLPSALILTAGCDPLRDEGEAYADRLKQAGVRVTLTRYSGMIHGFFGFAGILDEGKTAIDQVAQALQAVEEQMRLQDERESIEF
ncbi:alpha/beta hydrolase [Ktedonospora formicarum]|uniref:Acetylhydrolase n=1 Tax=Ktedonospora formicarum TaxID=2778364 RepID=A0A8J3IAS8_9CHLR|nr:alpha/beta hydrolase [Ktedonospora formicarum]GHO49207.1 acetylhydrolase [Ktedonospora formicarum]